MVDRKKSVSIIGMEEEEIKERKKKIESKNLNDVKDTLTYGQEGNYWRQA